MTNEEVKQVPRITHIRTERDDDYRLLSTLTLELVESRLKEISQRHNLDITDESLLYLYSKEYGSLTNEIADIL